MINRKLRRANQKSVFPQPAKEPTSDEIRYIVTLFNQGRLVEAESLAQKITERFPNYGFGWKCLGTLQKSQGQTEKSLEAMQKAAILMPEDHEAQSNLGVTLKDLGRLEEAADSYRRALQVKPDFAEAHNNLGVVYNKLGFSKRAEACYRQALGINPDIADVHSNLGEVLNIQGRLEEAESCWRRVLEIKSESKEAYLNLGNCLVEQGCFDEAENCYRRVLDINPESDEAYLNLGNCLVEQGCFDEAEICYRRVLEINPDCPVGHNNLGNILKEFGQQDDSVACYRRALEIMPDYAEAHNNLGSSLKELGRLEESEPCFRRALELKPGAAETHSNLLFNLNYIANRPPSSLLAEARRYGEMIASKVGQRYSSWTCIRQPERLRVGLVSGDLINHPVGFFLESVLAQIDQSRIELIAYSTNFKEDDLTDRIKPYFSAWKSLVGLSDESAAKLIHSDGIHLLLDLSGHTAKNRLPVFAWKPAPVQATWLGYFATTGVAEIDYLLADEAGVPDSQRGTFSETVWYLPDTRLCFSPPENELAVSPLPAVESGHITFGCCQNLAKVGDAVLSVWGEILNAVPNSKIRIQAWQFGDKYATKRFISRATQHGIDSDRLILHNCKSRTAYLAAYAEVDIILDTFPYPGGTTTCEALWMGVPTLTLAGDSMLERQGASLLYAAGLTDWIATSEMLYISKAIAFAQNLSELSSLRAALRQQVLNSPIFDAQLFALNLEKAFWGMWERYQENQKDNIRL